MKTKISWLCNVLSFKMHNYEIIFSVLVFQEGTSKFATLELNPKRAQRRHQQQRDLVSRRNQTFYLYLFSIHSFGFT